MKTRYSRSTAVAFGIAFALSALEAYAQEVRVTWIGQACYMIESGGRTVIVDPPNQVGGLTFALPEKPADVVTISHNHPDHNNSAGVRGNFTLLDGRTTTERTAVSPAGIPFVLIPGFHDANNGATFGANTIVRWTQGGLNFVHFGDYGQARLTEAQLADLRDIDVAFVPTGGFFTIDARGAASLINEFRPRVAVLMHFRTGLGGPAQLATFPAVVEPFPRVVYKPSSLALTRAQLPASPEVWLMEVDANLSVVNAASSAAGVPVAPGSLASAYGAFPGAARQGAASLPLNSSLGNAEVLVGETAVPLLFSSTGQINFQIPAQEAPGQKPVEIRVGGQRVARGSVTILDKAPGLFLVLNQNQTLNSPTNPARRGELIQIFATGQGSGLSRLVPDGAASPASPLSTTNEEPGVFIEGRRMDVRFSGLTPGTAGVWQINALVAPDAPTGPRVSLVVLSGLVSNELTLAVQ
jgi:uncharacterized protein (TIGR03437 family)